jgi:predicted DNA-binding protein (UPF0251 family)
MQDMVRKGRHGKQKLSTEDVEAIRTMYLSTNLSQYEIADKFGIKQSHVCDIINRRKWADLSPKGEVLEVGLRLESPAIA